MKMKKILACLAAVACLAACGVSAVMVSAESEDNDGIVVEEPEDSEGGDEEIDLGNSDNILGIMDEEGEDGEDTAEPVKDNSNNANTGAAVVDTTPTVDVTPTISTVSPTATTPSTGNGGIALASIVGTVSALGIGLKKKL